MTDKIQHWLDGGDGPPLDAWTAKRFYRYAIEQNVSDPQVVVNATKLVKLTEDFAARHPDVPFDRIVEAVIAGMDPALTLTYYQPGVKALIKIKWRAWWQTIRKSPLKAIRGLL